MAGLEDQERERRSGLRLAHRNQAHFLAFLATFVVIPGGIGWLIWTPVYDWGGPEVSGGLILIVQIVSFFTLQDKLNGLFLRLLEPWYRP